MYVCFSIIVKGATSGPRKQTSTAQGFLNISVITETRESLEGQCAGVFSKAKLPDMI